MLQVVYYTAALFLFTLGICYATCAIVIFFRDLTQIINIVLQIGVWMTRLCGISKYLVQIFRNGLL